MFDEKNGVIVGGNYEKPQESNDNMALTTDGGKTWQSIAGLNGYRSSVTYSGKDSFYAVGPTGSDVTHDRGKSWKSLDRLSYNTVVVKDVSAIWAVGEKGMVANYPFLTKLFNVSSANRQ
jgi:photosystem II stability/assembly factor-like uncharacterized protein